MKYLIVFLILFANLACGTVRYPKFTDARLKPALELFVTDMRVRGYEPDLEVLASARVVDSIAGDPAYAGMCYRDKTRRIEVKSDTLSSKKQLRAILYHELLHCIYDAPHSENQDSLMYWLVDSRIVNNFDKAFKLSLDELENLGVYPTVEIGE